MWCTKTNDTPVCTVDKLRCGVFAHFIRAIYTKARLHKHNSPSICYTVTIIAPNRDFYNVRYCTVRILWVNCACLSISICVEWPSSLSPPAVETYRPVAPGQAPVLLSLLEYQITNYQRGLRLRENTVVGCAAGEVKQNVISIHGSNTVHSNDIIRQLCMQRISVFTTLKG